MPEMEPRRMAKGAKKGREKTVSVFLDFMLGTLGIVLGIGLGIAIFVVVIFVLLYRARHALKEIAKNL